MADSCWKHWVVNWLLTLAATIDCGTRSKMDIGSDIDKEKELGGVRERRDTRVPRWEGVLISLAKTQGFYWQGLAKNAHKLVWV